MLETLSANEIVSSIYRKEITPEEVVSYYLDRINKFNTILNAIVELKIIDDSGNDLPNDGEAYGHLMVRGPWILHDKLMKLLPKNLLVWVFSMILGLDRSYLSIG